MQKEKTDPDHGEKTKRTLIINIITTNLQIVQQKMQQEFLRMCMDNDYTLDPRLFREFMENETTELLNYFKSGQTRSAKAQGKQAAIDGINKDFFKYLYNAVFACFREHIAEKNLDAFCYAIELLNLYKDAYYDSFYEQTIFQKHTEQQGLYNALSRTIARQQEELLAKEIEIQENKINALKLENQRVQEENEQRINFMVHTGHELTFPITRIIRALDLLKEEAGPRNYKAIPVLDTELRIINKMISDIFDYQKILKGKIVFEHSGIINISKITAEKIKLYSKITEDKGIQVVSNIEEDLYVKLHPDAYDRILDNLLDNAIKFNKENGSIFVTIKEDTGFIKLSIRDTGIGIKKEDVKHIFDPFHQSTHREKSYRGIGMGLALIKRIIELVPAKIEVASEQGRGTIFTVTFRKAKVRKNRKESIISQVKLTKPISREKIILKKTIHDDKKATVLIIDDNEELLSFLQVNMDGIFNFYYADNAIVALRILNIIPKPDLILCDIMMKPLNGFQFLEKIQKMDSMDDVIFVFLTAKTTSMDVINGLKAGALDYICKPFNVMEIIEKMKAFLRNRDNQKKNITKRIKRNVNNAIDMPEDTEEIRKQRFNQLAQSNRLTEQQQQIMWFAKDNMSNKEIGDMLCITPGTVNCHIQNIKTNR